MEVINIFAETIAVKGAARSIIYDLPRNNHYCIPNALYQILQDCRGRTIESIIADYPDHGEIIKEYFRFLEEKEIIFYTEPDETALFPPISDTWDYPAMISNAIIMLDEHSTYSSSEVLRQLIGLNCYRLQIITLHKVPVSFWLKLFKEFNTSAISTVEIYTRYNIDIDPGEYLKLFDEFCRIKIIFLHCADKNEYLNIGENGMCQIYKSIQTITSENLCGCINRNYFNVNISLFTESQHHNTCLNRKVCIAATGDIKNCPSMSRSFGNIKDSTIAEAIEKQGFKDMWNIRKDEIEVCKACEFRHMCTDCRAFLEKPQDIRSKPLKCGYNPETLEWSDWRTLSEKQAAITYYSL
ncbi:MAG: grasp-with-spasm system SPASM domain peptide maturase [Bacteroidota bacterium]